MEKTWKFDHVGVIVKDLDSAIKYYQSIGIGPFTPNPSGEITDRELHGKPANYKLKGVYTMMGSVKFELIQPVEGDSVQKEFFDSKGEGINHIGFIVGGDLDKEVAKLEAQGFEVICSGKRAPAGGFVYVNTDKIGGVQIELMTYPISPNRKR